MKHNKKRRGFISLRTIISILAIALVLGFLGYHFYRWQVLTLYLDKVDKVQMTANAKIATYNKTFAAFKGDPESAKKLKPKFAEAEKAIDKVARDLGAIKPPGSGDEYHRNLVRLYKASATFYGDIGLLADYIVRRNAILEQFAKDMEAFGKRIESGQTDADVNAASRDMKTSADKALQDLDSLKKPNLAVYSNRALQDNLASVSSALATMDEGLNDNDVDKVKRGVAALQAAFALDWGQALFEGDRDGLKEFESRSKELHELQAKVTLERSAL